ncbi:hypothetical protein FC35_GL000536 [Limosilactobacillus coleohominis DSM 14060]|nr:hypothetical protein FC35_GL000536 [Limosilactobacillus coleohominis DSM 14060]
MTVKLNAEQQVAQVVRQQVKGMINDDQELLRQVIAQDAQFIHITGKVQSRDEWLEQIKRGRMHYYDSKEAIFQVSVEGDKALVIMRNELDARIYGFRNAWQLQSRVELQRRNDKWLITRSEASMY